jgi:phage/plasmid-like protein (TIGR03299 family)
MSHEIENMAFAHQVPWHGLGTRVDAAVSVDDMIRLAGLDWTVSKRKMFAEGAGEVPDQFALTRDSDGKVLSVVGNRWKPVQNKDAFEFFRSFVEKGGATMETAGSLSGGKRVWGLANLNAGFELKGGDVVKGYLLLMSPHIGGQSVIGKVTSIRVVCANTMAVAMKEQSKFEKRFSHVREFDVKAAQEAMGLAREAIVEFGEVSKQLRALKLERQEAVRIMAEVYQPHEVDLVLEQEDAANPSLKSVLTAYTSAPGALPGTAWGVLNAVTFHADHLAGKSADARLTSAWMGTEATRKDKVYAALTKLAA